MKKLSQEATRMINEVAQSGKATFVHGSNRRHSAAIQLIKSGEYAEVKVGYNLYRLVSVADYKIERLVEAGIIAE